MKIKIIQNKDIRVWKYPSHNKYQCLLSFIAKTFGYLNRSSYSLQYQDDEGDNINIRNDNDIDDALLFATEERRKSLKIYLISSTAMDNFLDDALGDIFAPFPVQHKKAAPKPSYIQKRKVHKKPSHKIHKIHKPQRHMHGINPLQSDPLHLHKAHVLTPKKLLDIIPSKPPNTKPMEPEDILASMFEEDLASQSSQASMPSKPAIMSPQNVLHSMAFNVDPRIAIHSKPNHPVAKQVNPSHAKPKYIDPQVNNPSAAQPESDNIIASESSDDLLQNLLNDNDVQPAPIMDPQDVIDSIINKPDVSPPSDNQDASEEPEQEERVEESVSELKLDDTQPIYNGIQSLPGAIASVVANNKKNDNGAEPLQPPEILQPKKVVPYYGAPTIQTKVPPVPFLQPYRSPRHAQNKPNDEDMKQNASNGTHETIDDNAHEEEKENDVLRLLQQFNELPDVPAHVVSAADIASEDRVDDDDEEEEAQNIEPLIRKPSAKTLEDIQRSLVNPMSFHDTNLEEIKANMNEEPLSDIEENEAVEQSQDKESNTIDPDLRLLIPQNAKLEPKDILKLIKKRDMDHDDEQNTNDGQEEEDEERRDETDDDDMEIDPISNGDEASDGNARCEIDDKVDENNVSNEDNDDNEIEDDVANEDTNDAAKGNEDGDKYQHEIDRLYAELDAIDMDFEITRIQSLNGEEQNEVNDERTEDIQQNNEEEEEINIVVNDDNAAANENTEEADNKQMDEVLVPPFEISPMHANLVRDTTNASDINPADKVPAEEEEVVDINENDDDDDDNNEETEHNKNNDIEHDNVDDENNDNDKDGSECSDDDDMDLGRTTPDPVHTEVPSDDDGGAKGEASMELENESEVIQDDNTESAQNKENDASTENAENIEEKQDTDEMNGDETNVIVVTSPNGKSKAVSDASSNKTSAVSSPIASNELLISPRDQRRAISRILREEQREQQKKQKQQEKVERLAIKKKEAELRKIEKEKQKQKRLEAKEILKNSKKYEKLRRARAKELNQFRAVAPQQSEIFSPNKNWYPIKFILDTKQMEFEFETVEDLMQIVELQCVKQYRTHPSFIECVFNSNNIHSPPHIGATLPTNSHCVVYIYYNWRSALNVKFQSINLGICEQYISKVNVFRITPWMNTIAGAVCDKNEETQTQIDPNDIYQKLLESELTKHKFAAKPEKKSSPLALFKFKSPKKEEQSAVTTHTKTSHAALLPENCEQTPNFRWKFDLTQDYSAFDPLLNDEVLLDAMHEYEIYFVQIRSGAVIGELPRAYDIFVVYLNCCDDEDEIDGLFCNINKVKKHKEDPLFLCLLHFVNEEEKIANEILSYLKYDRCYGFVTVARNTSVDIHHPITEQITFHFGSIADWIPCAIVGEKDFESDLLRLQKCAKWNNKQHISLSAFLNSIVTTYTM